MISVQLANALWIAGGVMIFLALAVMAYALTVMLTNFKRFVRLIMVSFFLYITAIGIACYLTYCDLIWK